jgi:hypothetical protein
MPTITSRVHPGTVSSVLRLVADWTAGIWDLSSLAFTIPTGLAGRRTTTLSSLPAFRTCYGPPCLSAQGQSRDLQHSSPMLARCGNIALRDIAHMIVSPINTGVPHKKRSSLQICFLSRRALILWRSKRDSLIIGFAQERGQGSASFLNRSNRLERLDFPWRLQQLYRTSVLLFRPCVERVCS